MDWLIHSEWAGPAAVVGAILSQWAFLKLALRSHPAPSLATKEDLARLEAKVDTLVARVWEVRISRRK